MRLFGLTHVTILQALTSVSEREVVSVFQNDASRPPRVQGVGPIFFGPPALHMGDLRGPRSINPTVNFQFFEYIAY
ncbi:hypothetical protein BDR03DRAFT_374858 [Suillus americanus]|nr:hypothetical protein BDR03DRAFT_374858 [Suillus americanus]